MTTHFKPFDYRAVIDATTHTVLSPAGSIFFIMITAGIGFGFGIIALIVAAIGYAVFKGFVRESSPIHSVVPVGLALGIIVFTALYILSGLEISSLWAPLLFIPSTAFIMRRFQEAHDAMQNPIPLFSIEATGNVQQWLFQNDKRWRAARVAIKTKQIQDTAESRLRWFVWSAMYDTIENSGRSDEGIIIYRALNDYLDGVDWKALVSDVTGH